MELENHRGQAEAGEEAFEVTFVLCGLTSTTAETPPVGISFLKSDFGNTPCFGPVNADTSSSHAAASGASSKGGNPGR